MANKTNKQVQKWEYLVLIADELKETLKRLGLQGWELAAMDKEEGRLAYGEYYCKYELIFKRPLDEKQDK